MKKQNESGKRCAWVAGATGYTGKHLTELLCAAGESVVAHIRPESRSLTSLTAHFEELGAQVNTHRGALGQFASEMEKHGVTHIYALLGTTKAKARAARKMEFKRIMRRWIGGMTLECLNAAMQMSTPPVFVYLSAAVFLLLPEAPTCRVRWAAEERIRSSGLPFVIAHPALITGPDREEHRPLERFGDVASRGIFALARGIGAGKWADRYATVSGETLARGLIGTSFDPEHNRTIGVPELHEISKLDRAL